MAGTTREIEAVLKMRDEMSAHLKKVNKNLKGLDKSFNKNKKTLADLKLKYIAAAAAMAVIIRVTKGAINAQSKQVDAINKLNLALANQGNLLPGTSQRLQEYASSLQKITTFGDETILQAQSLLASFGMNEEQLKRTTVAALDFATATGSDLKMAVNLLGKAFVGETGSLSRYGIIVDKNIPKSEKFAAVMEQMSKRFGGQAQADVATFSGRLKQFENAAGDAQEGLGFFIGQLFDFGSAGGVGIGVMERLSKFFSQDLVIALGFARKGFSHFLAAILDGIAMLGAPFAKLAEKLGIGFFEETRQGIKNFADGLRSAGDEMLIEAGKASVAGAKTLDFKNNTAQAAAAVQFMTLKTGLALKPLELLSGSLDELTTSTLRFQFAAQGKFFGDADQQARMVALEIEKLRIKMGKDFPKAITESSSAIGDWAGFQDEAITTTENFGKALQESANLAIIFGNTLTRVFGGAASAIGGFQSLFGGGKGIGGFFKSFQKEAASGAMVTSLGSVVSGLASAIPAIGAIAGMAVQVFSMVFKPKWKKVAEEASKIFGKALSEGLSRELVDIAKQLGSTQNAFAARIGDIIGEVGIDFKNQEEILRSFGNLLGMVENGTLDWAEAAGQVDKAFGPIADHLETLGIEGSFMIGELITRMKELGAVTAEVQDFIKEKAQSAVEHLTVFFEYLLKQEQLTGEEAAAAVTQMAGAFQAAVAATGNLADAIAMLGPSFGELLAKLRETLGENDAMLNAMTRYYNFVSANQEQLSAIAALSAAFKELAAIGIINKNNINEFAAAFKQQFEDILSKTKDQSAALIAMGPQIAQLLEAYKALGLQVPPWLADLAEEAKKAGASLEPPEGLPDILKDIRDILLQIGEAFGIAAKEAKGFGTAASNAAGAAAGTQGPGGGGADYSAQGGLDIPRLNKDALIQTHKGEGALIGNADSIAAKIAGAVAAAMANVASGGPGDVYLDSEKVGRVLERGYANRVSRIHPGGVM